MLSFICESMNFSKNSELEIIEEKVDERNKVQNIVFRSKLQTANEVNSNRRVYSKEICKKIVEDLKGYADNKCLFQEIDHPFVTGDAELQKKRALTVELKNSASIIRKIYMEGNDIIGEIQTLSGFQGPALRDLIVKDQVNIGFSLRMLGSLKQSKEYKDVNEIVEPIKPITYDLVTNPSHKTARVIEFIPENFNVNDFNDSVSLINENANKPHSSDFFVNSYISSIIEQRYNKRKSFQLKM